MLTVKPLALLLLILNITGYIDEITYKRLEKYNIIGMTTYLDILVFSLVSTLISCMFISIFIIIKIIIKNIKK